MKILLVYTKLNWKNPMTIVPFLIRKVTGNIYNHCSLFDETLGKQVILESDITGVVGVKLVDWIKDQIVTVIEINDGNSHIYRNKAYSLVGKKKYSFIDLLWFMPIWYFTKWLTGRGRFYGRKVDDAKNLPTCYEYVSYSLMMDDWYRMNPDLFISHCVKRGYKIIDVKIPAYKLLG